MSRIIRACFLWGVKGLFLFGLLINSCVTVSPTTSSYQPPPIYGYRVGDHYQFSDELTVTLDSPEGNLLWNVKQRIAVTILSIDENVGGFTIRIRADVANISGGADNYVSERFFEGYTPIVAGPSNYFTHNEWQIHLIDWNYWAQFWMDYFNYVGYREQDLDRRYFYWNYTQYISEYVSITDIDGDGSFDSYQAYNYFTAEFSPAGIALLRRINTAFHFENGYQYSRLRVVEQILPETSSVSSNPPVMQILIAGIIVSCIVLFVTVIVTHRRRNSNQ